MSGDISFLLYNTPEGDVLVDAVIRVDSIWLTQMGMAELSGVQVPAVNKHLKNIFEEGELSPAATIFKMEIVQNEGSRNVRVACAVGD